MSLKVKISLAVSFLVVSLIATLGQLFLGHIEKQIKDDISAHQRVLVSSFATNIDEKLQLAHQELTTLADALPRDFSLAQQTLAARQDAFLIFNNALALISAKGRLLALIPEEPEMYLRDFSQRPYFRETVKTGRSYISRPFTSYQGHSHPIIMMTAPIFDTQGNVEALLVGSIDLTRENLLATITTTRLGDSGYLYLFAPDRTMILHPDPSRIMQQDVPPGVNKLFDRAIEGFEGSGETINSREIPMLASFKHLKSVDWIMAATTPLEQAYAPVRQARYFLVSALSVAALLSIAATWGLMHFLMNPLERFTEHVRDSRKKSASQRRFPIVRNDEIGVLAEAFNHMVTEVEQEEKTVRNSEARLAEAQRMAKIGSWECEPSSERLFWSEEMYRITGVNRTNRPQNREDFLALIHPEDRPRIEAALNEALSRKRAFVQEHRFVQPDGSARMVHSRAAVSFDENNRPNRIFGTVQDITEARRTEEELRASRQRFLIAFNANPDGIAITRREDGKLLEINAAMLKMLGVERKEALGRTTIEAGIWVNPAQRTVMLSLLKQKGRVNNLETWLRRADGITFPTFLSASRLNYNGEPCLLSVVRDVTEFKRMEDELRKSREELQGKHSQLQELYREMKEKNQELENAYADLKKAQTQLVHQEKMASIGQLAAGVAHEINNPIGFISSNLGTLEKYLKKLTEFLHEQSGILEKNTAFDPNSLRDLRRELRVDAIVQDIPDLIQESLEGTRRVTKIVQDLKNFSRSEIEKPIPFGLTECLESAINMAWNEIKYKAELERNYTSAAKTAGFPGQLGQVFLNLLVNAAQASEKNGSITINTFDQEEWVVIEVADKGKGIAAEDLKQIFNPFFTTKDVGQGTGLGLSIAYDIVQKHEGEISVTSEPGQGTCFRIKLPIYEESEDVHD